MQNIGVIKTHKNAIVPHKNQGDIGWDIHCVADETFIRENGVLLCKLRPGCRNVFHTGIHLNLPESISLILWDRSGLSAKQGVHRLAGVIDSSYRGEILVCLINLSDKTVDIKEGDKIIQGVLQQEVPAQFIVEETLQETLRNQGGFGSTGD